MYIFKFTYYTNLEIPKILCSTQHVIHRIFQTDFFHVKPAREGKKERLAYVCFVFTYDIYFIMQQLTDKTKGTLSPPSRLAVTSPCFSKDARRILIYIVDTHTHTHKYVYVYIYIIDGYGIIGDCIKISRLCTHNVWMYICMQQLLNIYVVAKHDRIISPVGLLRLYILIRVYMYVCMYLDMYMYLQVQTYLGTLV